MRLELINTEPYGALVKSTVMAGETRVEVYHYDLPPDESGIFSVAQTLLNAPPVEIYDSDNVSETKPGEKVGIPEPVPAIIPEERLAEARKVAKKLNKLGKISVDVAVQVIEGIE